jgi:glutamate racemase
MIEEGWIDHSILHATLSEYLTPHIQRLHPRRGVALLGCTHYPWIAPAIQKALPGWIVVDSAQAVVSALKNSEFKPQVHEAHPVSRSSSRVEFIFTDPGTLPHFAQTLIQDLS